MLHKIKCKDKDKNKVKSNGIKASAHPRTWKSVSNVIKKADVEVHQQQGDITTVILAILKRKNKAGHIIENCNLYPEWTIMYNGIRVKKDLLDFLTILKDTLIEFNPQIKIIYKCKTGIRSVDGRILGFVGTKSDDGLYEKFKNPYNCHFNIKLNNGDTLPPTIRRFQISITGKLLPKHIYKYGYCNKTDNRVNSCSDMDYIKNTGDIYWAYGIDRCRVFDLRKGNPNQGCAYILGK